MRSKTYYPENQIQKNLYTNGQEWMILDNWEEYRGYYHRYSTGEVFTGNDWNAKTSKKLTPYKNRSKMFFDYIDNKNYIRYGNEKTEIISGETFNTNRYTAPRSVKRKPSDQEIMNGVMHRYFTYKRNEPNRVFFEINYSQYSSYEINQVGINKSLYGLLEFKWKLDGPEFDVYNDQDILIDPGVFNTNQRIVLRHSQKFPKLAQVVTNFLEYTVYDM